MSSSTTVALSHRPLGKVVRGVAGPRVQRGARHDLTKVSSRRFCGGWSIWRRWFPTGAG